MDFAHGINLREFVCQFISRGFIFAKKSKKRENTKVSPSKVYEIELNEFLQ